ncbi:MAG: hypothetical protein ACI9GW_002511, partial [Halieaceae bacterium]
MTKYSIGPSFWPRATFDTLTSLADFDLWRTSHELPHGPVTIGSDFVGVNIATSADPRCDEYVLERLRELDIRHVRMDYSYCSINSYAERLLHRLLADDYRVMLDIFPPIHEARRLSVDIAVEECWRRFCREVFEAYGTKVDIFEIGNTPNRGRWSGFGTRGYVLAWEIAKEEALGHKLKLAGPNVSDFEPLYNKIFLSAMRRAAGPPDIHTDNLFVERVLEPEAYDHRVLGTWATNLLRLNLVKKARVLRKIGEQNGVAETICTYKCWTTKRLNRMYGNPQDKKVDYLVRYLVLASLSGALSRVYWGPLICSRDGLIDNKTEDYPVIDQVSFYREVTGVLDNFSPTPGFTALKFLGGRMRGSRCLQAVSAENGLSHFIFESADGREFHLCWCRDRQVFSLADIYTQNQLEEVTFRNACGDTLDQGSRMVTEHPLYIDFPTTHPDARPGIPTREALANVANYGKDGTVFINSVQWQTEAWKQDNWIGAFALDAKFDANLGNTLSPALLQNIPIEEVLRDTRNRIWNIAHPANDGRKLAVKLNRVIGLKRLSYRFRLSKGKRHWNNACELLHRGIATPAPVAFYEQCQNSSIEDSYYICEYKPDAFSTRAVYSAFKQGDELYRNRTQAQWLKLLATFISNMHNRRIVHRDLSAGNILFTEEESGEISPWLIDIGRAQVSNRKLSRPRRLVDLMRICYKLEWREREIFID